MAENRTKEPLWFSAVTVLATVVIAGAAVLNYFVTHNQLEEMRSTSNQTDKSIEQLSKLVNEYSDANNISRQSLNNQDASVSLTGKSVVAQQEYYQKITRPFIHVGEMNFVLEEFRQPDSIYRCKYTVENIGFMPAKSVKPSVVFSDTLRINFFKEKKYDPTVRQVTSAMFPKDTFEAKSSEGIYANQYRTHNRPIYAYFTIVYSDMAGKGYYFHTIRTLTRANQNLWVNEWTDFN